MRNLRLEIPRQLLYSVQLDFQKNSGFSGFFVFLVSKLVVGCRIETLTASSGRTGSLLVGWDIRYYFGLILLRAGEPVAYWWVGTLDTTLG